MKLKNQFFLILFFSSSITFAQQKGTIAGVVIDASMNNESMPSVSISVEGTKQGVNTDGQGKFKLELDAGKHVLVFTYVGYQTLRDTVDVQGGKTIALNVAMMSDAQVLDDVVVTGEVRKDTESALLRKQMNSAVITQSIGAQEMSRKGVSNAAVAITKVTGIAKQEGTTGVFVRGLGDRYNNTLLNGLPIPSNESTSKNISLNLFNTDIIQSIGISKIYTVDDYGDVGGATVNISSKEHVGKPTLRVEIGGGLNSQAFRSDFKRADNWKRFGFYNIKTPTSINEYPFQSRWTPKTVDKPFDYNFRIQGGTGFSVGTEGRMNVFATLAHENDYGYEKGTEKVIGSTADNVIADFRDARKYTYETQSTGMLNVDYRINAKNRLKWNSIFINSSSSSVDEYNVFPKDQKEQLQRQILTEQNKIFLNQLLGENQLNERFSLDWALSYGKVNADMPDRITNVVSLGNNGNYEYSKNQAGENNRYFQSIKEDEFAGRFAVNYALGTGKLALGYTGRIKKRDFTAMQLNIRIHESGIAADMDDIDSFLNASHFSSDTQAPNSFDLITSRGNKNLATPSIYNAKLNVHGAYVNFENKANDQLTYTVGVRADKVLQELTWDVYPNPAGMSFSDADVDKLFILPAFTLKYALTERENLRIAASRSYTLPQFLEKAPFQYEAPTYSSYGNSSLKPADNYNVDLKWEQFPSSDELFSFGLFGKYIKDPISRTLTNAASSTLYTFVNGGDYAYVFGAELEARKNIDANFSAGANLTYMYSRQELDPEKVTKQSKETLAVNFNTDHDALQGASPLLANADITYKTNAGKVRPMIALVGSYFYDRIFSLGSFGRGNIVEKGYPTVNFNSTTSIGDRWEVGLKLNNLLNNTVRMEQENTDAHVEVYSYKRGVDVSLGIKYKIF
ncbi:TonB-dependent receptor [Olivibacter ginsenosidimutans]|uniref:TonB-dependent receptor n=1 Tax=Olivibacter ginsenosidimutans TaxID=1176537 RepID=A0ABP9BJD0_9SPHI